MSYEDINTVAVSVERYYELVNNEVRLGLAEDAIFAASGLNYSKDDLAFCGLSTTIVKMVFPKRYREELVEQKRLDGIGKPEDR